MERHLDPDEPPILQSDLAHAPWRAAPTARLPGMVPVPAEAWFYVDEAYPAQMRAREHLIAAEGPRVCDALPGSEVALAELYQMVLGALEAHPDFARETGAMICPDGRRVVLDPDRPLATLGALVQEDLCLMEKPLGGDAHVLTASVLCFPLNWTLAEKLGRPLIGIHRPVPAYGPDLARRVQRLFDGLPAGRVLVRMNASETTWPHLYQPRPEAVRKSPRGPGNYMRIERQTLRRLPQTGAVLFGIHTSVVTADRLSPEDWAGFAAYRDVAEAPERNGA